MAKQLAFSLEILKEVSYQRCHHLSPLVQRRMDAMRFKSHVLLHNVIAEVMELQRIHNGLSSLSMRRAEHSTAHGQSVRAGRLSAPFISTNSNFIPAFAS